MDDYKELVALAIRVLNDPQAVVGNFRLSPKEVEILNQLAGGILEMSQSLHTFVEIAVKAGLA